LLAFSLIEPSYAIEAVSWLGDEVDFIVRQPDGGQAWRVRALIATDMRSVKVVDEVARVPEPSSLLLVVTAVLCLVVVRRTAFAAFFAQENTELDLMCFPVH